MLTTVPTAPDGDNGWFITDTSLTLTRNEPGTTYYRWNSDATVTYSDRFGAQTGDNSLWYWSADGTGNVEPGNLANIKVDMVAPADPNLSSSSHTTGTPSGDSTVDIDISGATDTVSGVEGFSSVWSESSITVPNLTLDTSASVSSTSSPPLADGTNWWVHFRTKDNAGNWTSTVHLGPFNIDSALDGTPPVTTLETTSSLDPVNGWYPADATQTYSVPFVALEGQNTLYY